jgi:CBS domain-containing protein
MSQRAAWQFERLGFADVYDFVVGKAHWLASGRPTIRSKPIARVGCGVTPATAAFIDDSVAAVRESTAGTLSDVVVVDRNRIVLGRVRRPDIETADDTDLIGEIMRLGPTTIRPDELVSEVTKRMAKRGVGSLLVTRPTGELIGEFVPSEEGRDE